MLDLDPFAKKEEPAPPKLAEVKRKEVKEARHFGMMIALFCAVCVAIMWYVTHLITTSVPK
jgi:hypothetical protein